MTAINDIQASNIRLHILPINLLAEFKDLM
jgi:hypothetical protein